MFLPGLALHTSRRPRSGSKGKRPSETELANALFAKYSKELLPHQAELLRRQVYSDKQFNNNRITVPIVESAYRKIVGNNSKDKFTPFVSDQKKYFPLQPATREQDAEEFSELLGFVKPKPKKATLPKLTSPKNQWLQAASGQFVDLNSLQSGTGIRSVSGLDTGPFTYEAWMESGERGYSFVRGRNGESIPRIEAAEYALQHGWPTNFNIETDEEQVNRLVNEGLSGGKAGAVPTTDFAGVGFRERRILTSREFSDMILQNADLLAKQIGTPIAEFMKKSDEYSPMRFINPLYYINGVNGEERFTGNIANSVGYLIGSGLTAPAQTYANFVGVMETSYSPQERWIYGISLALDLVPGLGKLLGKGISAGARVGLRGAKAGGQMFTEKMARRTATFFRSAEGAEKIGARLGIDSNRAAKLGQSYAAAIDEIGTHEAAAIADLSIRSASSSIEHSLPSKPASAETLGTSLNHLNGRVIVEPGELSVNLGMPPKSAGNRKISHGTHVARDPSRLNQGDELWTAKQLDSAIENLEGHGTIEFGGPPNRLRKNRTERGTPLLAFHQAEGGTFSTLERAGAFENLPRGSEPSSSGTRGVIEGPNVSLQKSGAAFEAVDVRRAGASARIQHKRALESRKVVKHALAGEIKQRLREGPSGLRARQVSASVTSEFEQLSQLPSNHYLRIRAEESGTHLGRALRAQGQLDMYADSLIHEIRQRAGLSPIDVGSVGFRDRHLGLQKIEVMIDGKTEAIAPNWIMAQKIAADLLANSPDAEITAIGKLHKAGKTRTVTVNSVDFKKDIGTLNLGSRSSTLEPGLVEIGGHVTDLRKFPGITFEKGSLIPKIGGKYPRNYRMAGMMHANGVWFSDLGFPIFTPYAIEQVHLAGLSGRYWDDAKRANEALGFTMTPKGFVWHHAEDGKTLQLIPRALHDSVKHTGGSAIIKAMGYKI